MSRRCLPFRLNTEVMTNVSESTGKTSGTFLTVICITRPYEANDLAGYYVRPGLDSGPGRSGDLEVLDPVDRVIPRAPKGSSEPARARVAVQVLGNLGQRDLTAGSRTFTSCLFLAPTGSLEPLWGPGCPLGHLEARARWRAIL